MRVKQYKLARRLNARIFPKTENPKLHLAPRGGQAKRRPRGASEYGIQLLEKQKARFTYGIGERQFANYVGKAAAKKDANPVEYLYRMLELRLDNIVYRLGIAKTRALARQMVSHGHITVNGRKVTVPSRAVAKGETVDIRAESRDKQLFVHIREAAKEHKPPAWLALDEKALRGSVSGEPTLDDYSEALFNLAAVIEYYSR